MSSAAIKFEPFDCVYLFGGTPLMELIYQEGGLDQTIRMYTAPRQASDVPHATVTDDINHAFTYMRPFELDHALGIGIGEAWHFGPEIRAAFGNRLIDFMSIPYPRYLGGAHVTHAILNGAQSWGCCMQQVTKNTMPGEIHDGAILDYKVLPFRDGSTADAVADLDGEYLEFICDFIEKANSGHAFCVKEIDPAHGTYYPRLNTQHQGWVDWSWSTQEIVRFIRAFDAPFPGARTTVAGLEVKLRDAYEFNRVRSHPFQSGLIVHRDSDYARVATRDGMIELRIDPGAVPDVIETGMRLFTSREQLERAMTYVPRYTPHGDAACQK